MDTTKVFQNYFRKNKNILNSKLYALLHCTEFVFLAIKKRYEMGSTVDITMAATGCNFLDTFYKDTKIEMVTILVLHGFGTFFRTFFGTLYWDTF